MTTTSAQETGTSQIKTIQIEDMTRGKFPQRTLKPTGGFAHRYLPSANPPA